MSWCALFGTFLVHFPKIGFCMHFGRLLAPFWSPFGSLWLPFGSPWCLFGSFSAPVGSLFVPFGSILVTFGFHLLPFGFFLKPFREFCWFFHIFSSFFHFHVSVKFLFNFNSTWKPLTPQQFFVNPVLHSTRASRIATSTSIDNKLPLAPRPSKDPEREFAAGNLDSPTPAGVLAF